MSERAEIEAFGLQTGTDGGIVRRAIISDVPAIMRLLRQVLSVHNASRPDLFKPEGGKYSEKELETIIADGERPVFVFVDAGGEVLGHCFCIIEDYPETGACYPRKTLYIDDLCVDSGARRRHVGRICACGRGVQHYSSRVGGQCGGNRFLPEPRVNRSAVYDGRDSNE